MVDFAKNYFDAFRSALLNCRLLFEPTNDFPLSEKNVLCFPFWLKKRLVQLIVESVLRSFETSRWTALTARHVNACHCS